MLPHFYNKSLLIQWLPPYLPDFNALEEAFSKVKLMMKAMEIEI